MVTVTPLKQPGTTVVNCQATDNVEDIVYIKSTSASPYTVERVNVYDSNAVPGVAIIKKKLSSTKAVIQYEGEIKLSTFLSPGKSYFIGSDGRPSITTPTKGAGKTYIQIVGVALNNDTLLLRLDKSLLVQQG